MSYKDERFISNLYLCLWLFLGISIYFGICMYGYLCYYMSVSRVRDQVGKILRHIDSFTEPIDFIK